jgi:acetolactate synthase-1/2/3 large subunit
MITDSYKLIPPDAHLIHVNVDGEPIGQNFPTRTAVVADVRTFLTAVLRATDRLDGWHRNGGSSGSRHVEDVAAKRQAWRDRRDGLASQDGLDGRPMRPEAVMAVMEELLSDDAIIAADTGYSSAWSGAILDRPTSGRTFLRADGSLGWAFAGAMGAQLAEPERPVIAVIGDGGFGYHVGDLETALRLKLPVVTVILNNRTLAFEAHVQTLLYDHLVPEVDDFLDVDYAAVARTFGANGIRVENATEFRHALASGLERRGPTVIDAIIDRDAIAPVTRYDRVREREL